MLDPTFQARFEQLVKVKITERQKLFPDELDQIDSQAAARGMFHSSFRVHKTHQSHERELDIRSILTWECLVRVHRTLGQPMSDTLRDDMKAELHKYIDQFMAELAVSLDNRTKKSGLSRPVSLTDAHKEVTAKHDAEVELYVDSLSMKIDGSVMAQNYNFYGAVGSVQTGANATANVIQNLGAEDKNSLSSAIKQVREALSDTSFVGEQQRQELLEIADECLSQMSAKSPNNTKLLTMFNVLGTSIQSIASAQPAYQALKVAILPLGITLP